MWLPGWRFFSPPTFPETSVFFLFGFIDSYLHIKDWKMLYWWSNDLRFPNKIGISMTNKFHKFKLDLEKENKVSINWGFCHYFIFFIQISKTEKIRKMFLSKKLITFSKSFSNVKDWKNHEAIVIYMFKVIFKVIFKVHRCWIILRPS